MWSIVCGFRWSTSRGLAGRSTIVRYTTIPCARALLVTPSEAYTGMPGPVLYIGPVYGYADQVPEFRTGSYHAISFKRLGWVKSITSTPPVYQALTSRSRPMPMTAMPMCAEQYSPAAGFGRTSPTWNSLRKVPSRSEKNIRPVLWTPPAGFHGRGWYVVIGGQPLPNDSSTQFTVSASLSNITEWKKSTAPGNSPVPPEVTSSSPIEIGFRVSGIPFASISHTWPCSAQAAPARRLSTWTTMSWQAIAAGSRPVGGFGGPRPRSNHSIMPSGSPG